MLILATRGHANNKIGNTMFFILVNTEIIQEDVKCLLTQKAHWNSYPVFCTKEWKLNSVTFQWPYTISHELKEQFHEQLC